MQISMKTGENEKIMDLADSPEFVLMEFCKLTMKHHGLEHPDARNRVKECLEALKIKMKKNPIDSFSFDRDDLKNCINTIEGLLEQYS